MNDFIKNMKSLEDSGLSIDGVTETVKYEIKNKKADFFSWNSLAPLATSLVQPVISSVVKGISGREVRRAGRGYITNFFYFCSIFYTIFRLLIISIINQDVMAFFQEIIYLEEKMKRVS